MYVKRSLRDKAVCNVINPISNKIFDFSTFVPSNNVDANLESPESLLCNFKGSQYVAKDIGLITTGDLRILSDNKFRKIL